MAGSEALKYDVFISHRGPDTKRNFAALLKTALGKQMIKAFHDHRDLVPGQSAPDGLRRAMEGAELGIVILSPGFFESRYCMEELDFFLSAGRVLPVLVDLTVDMCKAERIIERSRRPWKSCKMEEAKWKDILRQLQGITMLTALDGYWDTCLYDIVRETAKVLGRPAPSTGLQVNMVPFFIKNVEFLGREEELGELRKLLSEKMRACISGTGGMGKTQLVLEYTYRYHVCYASILWIDADSMVIRENYSELSERLGVKPGPDADPVAFIRSYLEERLDGPYLLIFDNVEDEAGFWRKYMPRRGPSHVIVTTRLQEFRQFGNVKLRELRKDDALRLARGATVFGEQEEAQLEVLAARFGYLTLALAVSSQSFKGGPDFWPSKLLQRLNSRGPRVFQGNQEEQKMFEDPVFKKHPDLEELFQASFEAMGRDAGANDAEKLLANKIVWVGGWFAPGPVRKDLLAVAACGLALTGKGPNSEGTSEPDVEQGALEGAVPGSVRLLLAYGVADVRNNDSVSGAPALSFHLMLQSFGRLRGGTYAGVAMANALAQAGRVEEDKVHFQSAFRLVRFRNEPEASPEEIRLEVTDEADFITSVGMALFRETGRFMSQSEVGQAIQKRCLDGLRAGGDLMLARWEDSQVQKAVDEASGSEVESRRNQASTVTGLVAIAKLALHAQQVRESEPPESKALEAMDEEVERHDWEGFLWMRGLRALMLQRRGRYGEAEVLLRKILRDTVKKFGPSHLEAATAQQNLALCVRMQGREAEAEPMYWRVWEIRVEALGPDDRETGVSLINLAFLVQARGRRGDAEMLFRAGLEIMEAVGAQDEFTAQAMYSLALHLLNEGRANEAEPFAKRALDIMEQGSGPNHDQSVAVYRDLYDKHQLAPYKQAGTPTATPVPATALPQAAPGSRAPPGGVFSQAIARVPRWCTLL